MEALTIKQWSQSQFSQAEKPWQELLTSSPADPLFMSWHWQHQWWQLYSQENHLELFLLACYRGNELLGLAPLYRYKTSVLRHIKIRRINTIGNQYRHTLGIRAEYQSFIAKHDASEVYQALWNYTFNQILWHEAYMPDLALASTHYQCLQANIKAHKVYQRINNQETSYSINTQGSFDDYLSSLGKNTRLKLFNRRKLLEKKGAVELSHVKLEGYDALLEALNRFHQTRWGCITLSDTNHEFLKHIMQHSDSQSSIASLLTLDGEPLSTMLNLQFNKRIYNIQLGFLEDYDRKISLGTLHLGYAIEAAFQDPDINCFDLLAGAGKNDNYKVHIAEKDTEMISPQIVKAPLLKLIYKTYDAYQAYQRRKKLSKDQKPSNN